MPYTKNADHQDAQYSEKELGSAILDHLLQGHTVILDSDFVPESHLETLFESVRDDLLKLVKHGDISVRRVQKALTNLVTKSSLEGMTLPNSTPTIIVRMHMLASIEEY